MKKLIIILSLFISYSSYAQYVPKAGNKLNTKPNGILVPTSTTDDTPIARLELFNTGASTVKSSALDTTGLLATKANSLTLAQTFARFGSGNFFTNSAHFVNGGTNNTTDVFSLNPTFIASKQDVLVSGTNIKTLGGASLLGSGDFGILSSTYGGTGVNNGGRLLTYAGAVTFAGAFTNTITATANTTVTFPTTGTLYGTATGSITSAQLLASLSNETGTGVAVFGTSPTIATPNLTYTISTKTANYTVVLTDVTVKANTTSTAITFTLPTASSASGKIFNFKRADSGTTNALTIQANGAELIDGTNTKVTTAAYGGFTVHSDGTTWSVLL